MRNNIKRIVFITAAVVGLLYATSCKENPSPTTQEKQVFFILSDTSGEIREVVLQFGYRYGEDALPAHKDLIRKLEPDTTVYVLCANENQTDFYKNAVKEMKVRSPERIKIFNAGKLITVWTRDRFISKAPADGSGDVQVVLPALGESPPECWINDREIPRLISSFTGRQISIIESSLTMQGGNFVANDRFLFSAYNPSRTFPYLVPEKPLLRSQAATLVEKELGKKAIIIGNGKEVVPAWHIDMYMTPISDSVVLLGDLMLGENLLLGAKSKDTLLWRDSAGVHAPNKRSIRSYNYVNKELEKRGFTIERIPIVHYRDKRVVTYNNVLMETRAGKRIVYMPVYRLKELDNAAEEKYESLGFEVRTINVSRIHTHEGSIRCLANVLSRRYCKDD